MGKAKIYNIENVLYAANKPTLVNVSQTESQACGRGYDETDLQKIVREQLQQGHLEFVTEDDSDKYYRITLTGRIKLLRLQIKWRTTRNKDIKHLQDELSDLL